jgi:hypothetical protein
MVSMSLYEAIRNCLKRAVLVVRGHRSGPRRVGRTANIPVMYKISIIHMSSKLIERKIISMRLHRFRQRKIGPERVISSDSRSAFGCHRSAEGTRSTATELFHLQPHFLSSFREVRQVFLHAQGLYRALHMYRNGSSLSGQV